MELPRGAKRLALRVIMTALPTIIRSAAKKHKSVREHLRKGDGILQLGLRDGSLARHYVFHGGRISAHWGVHPRPDTGMSFASVDTALALMNPNPDHGVIIDALKNFKAMGSGADRWTVWIGQFMHMVGSADWTAHVPATRPRPNA